MFLSISTQIHISASKVMTQTCDLVLSHEHTVAHPYQIHWDTGKETTLEAPLGHSLEDHQKAKRPLGLAGTTILFGPQLPFPRVEIDAT